jgi:hypothetical protein
MRLTSVLADPENPEIINVRMGAFDGDPGLRPTGRVHVASAAVCVSASVALRPASMASLQSSMLSALA